MRKFVFEANAFIRLEIMAKDEDEAYKLANRKAAKCNKAAVKVPHGGPLKATVFVDHEGDLELVKD